MATDAQVMDQMLFNASTSRSFVVGAAPSAVAAYFSQNTDLLSALVPGGQVSSLGEGRYRISFGRFAIPGLVIRPELDVAFVDAAGSTTMETCRTQVVEGPPGLELAVAFEGRAGFDPHADGCMLTCFTQAVVTADFPGAGLLPIRWLEAAGSAMLSAAMSATAARFQRILTERFADRGLALEPALG